MASSDSPASHRSAIPHQAHSPDAPPPPYPGWLYDAVHTGNPGDLEHYLEACSGVASVLELGCGSGRIAGPVAKTGTLTVGIDRSAEAIRKARKLGVDAREMDVRIFNLDRRFDRIIAPYNVLYCLLTEDDLLGCLRQVRAHLALDGEFWFDIYCADPLQAAFDLSKWSPEAGPVEEFDTQPVMRVQARGEAWDIFEDSFWWPHQQRIDARFRHVPVSGGEPIEAIIPQRYLLSGELSGLLAAAGLGIRAWHGGFDDRPFEPDAEIMVLRTAPL